MMLTVCPRVPSTLKRKWLRAWPILLLIAAGSFDIMAGVEIKGPGALDDPPRPPPMETDPYRPEGAPPASAIEGLSKEDGPAAGLKLAEKALKLSQLAHGAEDAKTIIPRINLAHAKQRAGETGAALIEYQKSIEMAASDGGPRDARLTPAWTGFAYANLLAGQFGPAQLAYEMALQLGRVNFGLNNPEQIVALHALAMAQRANGQLEPANESQIRRLETSESIYGLGSREVALLYVPIGRWFRNIGRVSDAIALHAQAVDILAKLADTADSSEALVDALIEAAISGGARALNFDQPPLPRNARPHYALKRAEALVDNSKQMSARKKADALLRIGDVHTTQNRRDGAKRAYDKAANLLKTIGDEPPFTEPAFIYFVPPHPPPLSGKGGDIIASFTVNEQGQVKQLRVIKAESITVPASVEQDLRKALRLARLRPRMVNGQAVETTDVRFRLRLRGDSA